MSAAKSFIIVVLAVVLLLMGSSLFQVNESQRGVVIKLGRLQQDANGEPVVKGPGIHLKWPFISQARLFDMRLQTLDIELSRIVTAEKKDVIVDYYAKWRINNPSLFYVRTNGDASRVETLLQQKLNDGLRAEFGRRDIQEVVSGARVDIMGRLRDEANTSAHNLGLEVTDVRIKRIDLPPEVSATVFERMRAERERIATEHRAQGKADGEAIRADADRNVTVALAQARRDAQKIKGEGDSAAAKIYNDTYSNDPSFYAFYRSLLAYQSVFNSRQDVLVVRPDSEFFKYFARSEGQTSSN